MVAAPRFGDFYRSLYPRVYRFVHGQTDAPPADVEDIVQETLLHAWEGRDAFEGQAEPETWVLSIARHKVAGLQAPPRAVPEARGRSRPRGVGQARPGSGPRRASGHGRNAPRRGRGAEGFGPGLRPRPDPPLSGGALGPRRGRAARGNSDGR